jgi:hypothetical protein
MVKIKGGSSTIGELEPRLHMGMGGERPRSPPTVSEMDGSSQIQFNPTALSPLDGKMKSKLGMIDIKGQIAAATKSDDAKIPEYVWDIRTLRLERPLKDVEKKSLDMLRDVMLIWWKRQVVKSLCKYLEMPWERELVVESQITNSIHGKLCSYGWATMGCVSYRAWWALVDRTGDHEKDHTIGRDCILRVADSTWWLWDGGSTPFFWLWLDEFRKSIRDGTPLWLDMDAVPEYRRPQRDEVNSVRKMMKEKLDTVRVRRYVESGLVSALTSFFAVMKGDDDIRIVFNGTL